MTIPQNLRYWAYPGIERVTWGEDRPDLVPDGRFRRQRRRIGPQPMQPAEPTAQ